MKDRRLISDSQQMDEPVTEKARKEGELILRSLQKSFCRRVDKAFAKLRLRVEEKPHPSSHPPIFSSCVGEGVIFAPFVLKLRFQKKVFINKHHNTLLCIV